MSHHSAEFAAALEAAKWTALKDFAYGASHEINNPLANIAMRAQALLRDETNADRRRSLRQIHAQAMRAHEMIADLMFMAKPPRLDRRETNLGQLIEQLLALENGAGEGTRITFLPSSLPIMLSCDAAQLTSAIAALCRNAREGAGEGGQIELTLKLVESSVEICVKDNGPGIPAAVLEHVFNPFYSGREAGRGLGFGLPKARRIAEAHGGEIRLTSRPGQTEVTLVLPLIASL